jgi:capsular polysaccharide transport system permease protein
MKFIDAVTPRRVLIWAFVVPVVFGAIYYAALAKERYVSESVIAVRDTSSGGPSSGSSLASLLGGAGNPVAISDTLYLQNYLHSADMLNRLEPKLHLRDHYADAKLDVFYKVWPWVSKEYFLDYFRNRVSITVDEISGLVTIGVEGFTPEYAKSVADAVLSESESFMNGYSHKIAEEKMSFAQAEVEKAQARALAAKAKIVEFQTKHKLLDPGAQAATNSTVTASLQGALTQQEAALKAALGYLQEDSYQVRTLRSQLTATQSQLETERLRGTSGDGSDKYGTLVFEYQNLLAQGAFQDASYQAAMISQEQARLDTLRKLKTLVVLQAPTQPESAIYPQRWYNFATVIAVFGMLFAIIRLVVATIREHQD